MATRVLNWCSECQLCCDGGYPATAFLCVNPYIVGQAADAIASLVEAILTAERPSTCADPCGPGHFVYTVSYDDEQLIENFALAEADIRTAFCGSNCLPCFFEDCKRLRKCCQVDDCTPVILLLKVDDDGALADVAFTTC